MEILPVFVQPIGLLLSHDGNFRVMWNFAFNLFLLYWTLQKFLLTIIINLNRNYYETKITSR